jgi:hypothetical protein
MAPALPFWLEMPFRLDIPSVLRRLKLFEA